MDKIQIRKIFSFMVLMFFSQVLIPCFELELQSSYLNKTASAAVISAPSSTGGEETGCLEPVFQPQRFQEDKLLFPTLSSFMQVALPESSNVSLSPKENSRSGDSFVLSAPLFLSHRILRI